MILIDFPYAVVVLVIVGTIGGLLQTRPIDKILMLAVLGDGLVGMIATYQYLDVAMASSFMTFVGIIIMMIGLIRTMEIKKQKVSCIDVISHRNLALDNLLSGNHTTDYRITWGCFWTKSLEGTYN